MDKVYIALTESELSLILTALYSEWDDARKDTGRLHEAKEYGALHDNIVEQNLKRWKGNV